MQVESKSSAKGWRQSFFALQKVEFRWLLASNTVFFLALHGQILTRSYLAWELTDQEMALATINFAFAVPMIFFSLIGGALTDRFERRNLIQYGQLILIANEFFILALLASGQLAFWHLVMASIIGGIILPVMMPARTAIVFNIVGASQLGNAMGLAMGVVNITRVVGPVLTGWAISQYTALGAYIVSSVLFSIAFIFMLAISKKPVTRDTHNKPGFFQDISIGLCYIRNTRPVMIGLLFGFLTMCLAVPIQNLFILFTDKVWHVGETGLGVMMSVAGLGGTLGSLWVASRGENTQRTKMMVINAIGFSLFLLLFSLSANFYLALAPLFIANICASAAQTLNNTTVQLLTDDSQRGRVSALMMMSYGVSPLGVLPLAWAAQYIGIAWTTTAASMLLAIIIGVFFLASITLRTLDQAVVKTLANHSPTEHNT